MILELGPLTVTGIGIIYAVLFAVTLIVRPRWFPFALAASLPLSHSAMIIVGENGLSPFWFGAILSVARLAYLSYRAKWRLFDSAFIWFGSNVALIAFAAYALVMTAIGPAVFSGLPVLSPEAGLDTQVESGLTPLQYETSNLAQGIYVVLGVLLVVYFLVEKQTTPRILEVAIVVGMALAFARHLLPDVWPYAFFDNSPSIYYAWPGEGRRERGSFAEPSILGMFLAMSLAYLGSAIVRAPWIRRVGYAVLIVAGIYLYAISYTGTALLAIGATAIAGGIVVAITLATNANRKQLLIALGVVVVAVIGVVLAWPVISRYTVDIVLQKLTTSSFDNRGGSNEIAFQTFLDTFALGAGMGSSRPSSLFFMLLSCVGIVGLLLFMRLVGGYIWATWRSDEFRAVSWSFVAVLIAQVTAKPDLSAPPFWILLALCAIPYRTIAKQLTAAPARQRHASLMGLIPSVRKPRGRHAEAPVPAHLTTPDV
jgi:hypothetical protein